MKTHSIALLLALLPVVAPAQNQTHAEIERRALESHPKVRAAQAALKSAHADRGLLAAPYKPMLTANGYFAAGNGAPIFSSTVAPVNWAKLGPDGVAVGNLMLMWSVWSGGRSSTARSLGSSRVEAAEHMLEAVRQDVLLAVRVTYAEHTYAVEALRVAKADLVAATETERIARQMEEAGKAPRAFTLRAESAARASERDLALAEASVAVAFAALEEAVGGPVEITLVPGLTLPELPDDLEQAHAASKARAEIAFFASMAKSMGLEAEMSRRSNLPELAFMTMGSVADGSRTGPSDGLKFGLVLSIPVSDGGMRRNMAMKQSAAAEKFLAQASQMELAVRREVESAWANWSATESVTKSAAAGLEAGEASYTIELLRFQAGKSILAELLDARTALTQARVHVAQAARHSLISAAKLSRAIGGN